MPADLPTHARCVVVGGGIMGCSTAYHLAKLGFGEVLLLERASLTSGSTFHAAGLVGQLRSSASITALLGYSVALYESLEAETGQATGWKRSGGLRLACNEERMILLRRQATTARSFGLEMELLTPSEARALWPLMEIDDLVGAAWLPSDGSVSPSDVTMALAKGARQRGARLVEGCPVTAVETKGGRVVAVQTPRGRVACEVLVNCCGQWAREFGAMAGVSVPVVSVEHQFLVTEPIEGVTRDLPTLRDPDRLTYYKEEVGGLIMGGYEPNPKPWAKGGIPEGFHFQLLEPDFEHFEQLANLAVGRVPAIETAGVRQLINGPEAFTPDGDFILGEAPELGGYFVGAGFNAFGIASGGGAGRALAEWIVGGEPPADLWSVDIRRFGRHHRDAGWSRARTLEIYGKHYTIAWPAEEHTSGRPLRRSPLYVPLDAAGACFGEKQGWERPNWFAPPGVAPRDRYSFRRPTWFGPANHVERNVMWNVGRGLSVHGTSVVRNNVVIDAAGNGIYVQPGEEGDFEDVVIVSNTVARTGGAAVEIRNQRDNPGFVLANNALANPTGSAVLLPSDSLDDSALIRGNIVTGSVQGLIDTSGHFTPGNGFGDFASPEDRDFYPGPSSSLPDAGWSSSEAWLPPTDFNGVARDEDIDVGAYERSGPANPGWLPVPGFKEPVSTLPIIGTVGCSCEADMGGGGSPGALLLLLLGGYSLGAMGSRSRSTARASR